jgi:hypothetical protein
VIKVRMHVVGEDKVAAVLTRAPDLIDFHAVQELWHIGDEIVSRAKADVPVGKTGNLRAAIRMKLTGASATGATGDKRLRLDVFHSGKGARHAHLIERGVREQVIDVHQRFRAQRLRVSKKTGKLKKGREYWERGALLYKRRHHIDPQPYFMPAVEGAGDVGARLEAAMARATADMQAGGR